MNAKLPAKHALVLTAAASVAAAVAVPRAAADDGNLGQRVHIEQSKSRFQLELEQIEERARRRAEAARDSGRQGPAGVDLGDSGESLRLAPVDPGGPPPSASVPESTRTLEARHDYERDQRRILDERQRRRALRAESPAVRSDRTRSYARERRERLRFESQNERQILQRKLRP